MPGACSQGRLVGSHRWHRTPARRSVVAVTDLDVLCKSDPTATDGANESAATLTGPVPDRLRRTAHRPGACAGAARRLRLRRHDRPDRGRSHEGHAPPRDRHRPADAGQPAPDRRGGDLGPLAARSGGAQPPADRDPPRGQPRQRVRRRLPPRAGSRDPAPPQRPPGRTAGPLGTHPGFIRRNEAGRRRLPLPGVRPRRGRCRAGRDRRRTRPLGGRHRPSRFQGRAN